MKEKLIYMNNNEEIISFGDLKMKLIEVITQIGSDGQPHLIVKFHEISSPLLDQVRQLISTTPHGGEIQ